MSTVNGGTASSSSLEAPLKGEARSDRFKGNCVIRLRAGHISKRVKRDIDTEKISGLSHPRNALE